MKSSSTFKQKLALIFGSIFFTCLLLELVLRFFGIHNPVLYRADEVLGYTLKENQNVSYMMTDIAVNDLGLRDVRNLLGGQKDDKTIRVGVFGDSVTWGGVYIEQDDLFTSILEKRLREQYPENSIEIYNAGVNGYSVAQAVWRAEELNKSKVFDVIVFYFIEADFYRNPYVKLVADVVPFYQTKRVSALMQVTGVSFAVLRQKFGFSFLPSPNAFEVIRSVDRGDLYNLHVSELKRFYDKMLQQSTRVSVFLSPRAELLYTDVEGYAELSAQLMTNISIHDLLPQFRALLPDSVSFFFDDVHFNVLGHKFVSDMLFDYFVDNNVLSIVSG